MSLLDKLLAKTAAATTYGSSDHLEAGDHIVTLKDIFYLEGFKGVFGIVEFTVDSSTTVPAGASRSVCFRLDGTFANVGMGNFKAWLLAEVVEFVRMSGKAEDLAFDMSQAELSEEKNLKMLTELKLVGHRDDRRTVMASSENCSGIRLRVSSKNITTKEGKTSVVHNHRPFTVFQKMKEEKVGEETA